MAIAIAFAIAIAICLKYLPKGFAFGYCDVCNLRDDMACSWGLRTQVKIFLILKIFLFS